MVFSTDENSTLGVVGIVFLCALLSFICISLLLIAWDTCRPSPPNRRSRYLEFDPIEQKDRHTAECDRLSAKKTLIYYGLGMFCLYVFPDFLATDIGMSVA